MLHEEGSNNVLGVKSGVDKVPFHHFNSLKDLYGGMVLTLGLAVVACWVPYLLGDCENFRKANEVVTPEHIKPEWYFLFAYAILRSIPNKLGGVIALIFSVMVLQVLPYLDRGQFRGVRFRPLTKIVYWVFVGNFVVLT